MQVRPLMNRVFVRRAQVSSDILLRPYSDPPHEGIAVAVGDGKMSDGRIVHMEVAVGDRVLFMRNAGTEIRADVGRGEETLLTVRQDDILLMLGEDVRAEVGGEPLLVNGVRTAPGAYARAGER